METAQLYKLSKFFMWSAEFQELTILGGGIKSG